MNREKLEKRTKVVFNNILVFIEDLYYPSGHDIDELNELLKDKEFSSVDCGELEDEIYKYYWNKIKTLSEQRPEEIFCSDDVEIQIESK